MPDKILSDIVTNFRGKLTTDFLKRVGCCLGFSTLSYPQACGLVKRSVGSIKLAISMVAIGHLKQ